VTVRGGMRRGIPGLVRVVLLNQHGICFRVQNVLTVVALSLTESLYDDS
jgi:hypothetical protein